MQPAEDAEEKAHAIQPFPTAGELSAQSVTVLGGVNKAGAMMISGSHTSQ